MSGEQRASDLSSPYAGGTAGAPAKWGPWATIGLTLLVIAVAVVVQTAAVVAVVAGAHVLGAGGGLADTATRWGGSGLALAVGALASAAPVAGLAFLFARLRRGASATEYLALRPVPLRRALVWTLFLGVFIAASDLVTVFALGRPLVPEVMVRAYRTAGFVPLFWVAVVVAAPLYEEMLFRGFMLEGLRLSRLGPAGGVLITSLAWTACHIQYDAFGLAWLFLAGVFLGAARLRSGSTLLAMMLHAMMNLVAIVEVVLMLRHGRG